MDNLRIPPHSIDAEAAFLSAVFERNTLIEDCEQILKESDFYNGAHKVIYRRMCAMAFAGQPIDPITLCTALESAGEAQAASSPDYVIQLATEGRGAHNAMHYAKIISERAMDRDLISKGVMIADLGYSDGDPFTKLDEAQKIMMESGPSFDSEVQSGNQVLQETLKEIHRLASLQGALSGVTSGYTDLDKITNGFQAGDMIVVAGRPSMGKELHNDAKVLKIDGTFKRIGDIMVGERVASIDGKESTVFGVFPQGVKPVYSVTFSDGRTVKAGLEHQWEVMYRDWDSPRVITTQKLITMLESARYQGRLYIAPASGDFGHDENIKIHPYLLGAILGDGGLSAGGVKISNSDEQIVERVKLLCGNLDVSRISDDYCDYRIHAEMGQNNWLIDAFKDYGLYGLKSVEKYIPDEYLRASKETRRQLIMGLLDTDGTVETFGALSYSTSSERLANDFLLLARSLGFWAKLSSRIPKYTYKGEKLQGQRTYKISLSHKNAEDFISLPRKRERLLNKKSDRVKRITIESVTFDSYAECTCISVTHPRELFICDDYIVTHNTTFAMNCAEAAIDAGELVLVFSLEMPARQLMLRMISSRGRIPLETIKRGNGEEQDYQRMTAGAAKIKDRPIYIDDTSSMTSERLLSRARKLQKKAGKKIGMIIIDYLQLLADKGEGVDRVTKISRNMKLLAKEIDCPVLALSQLSRKCEERGDQRPISSDLRDSGAIEQDADLIIMAYRDEVVNKNSQMPGVAEFIIRKHRNGELGTVYLKSNLHICRFDNNLNYMPPTELPTGRKYRSMD